jgi:ABC-type nitrate/sulfonate/bicarbonate transport system ATPase subunit
VPEKTDEELLALMAAEEAAKGPPPGPAEPVQFESNSAVPVLSFFKRLTGADMLCIFGDTGSGKSKLVCEMALAEQRSGGRVVYFDLESDSKRRSSR